MLAARQEFYATINAMRSITEAPLLLDVLPVGAPQNVTARILRHGLAVSAFSLLERYLKEVFSHLVTEIQNSKIGITDFPLKLQKFLIVDSISGFNNKISFIRDDIDKISYVLANINQLHGFMIAPPKYSATGFSPSGSNIGHEDVKRGFRSFLVSNPWGKMTTIATDIGAATLSLEDDFKALARARHQAAHDPAGNIPTANLQAHLGAATTIAMTADLLGCAVSDAIVSCKKKADFEAGINNARCHFRFLDDLSNGRWAEKKPDGKRVVRLHVDRSVGVATVSKRSGTPRVVIRNSKSQPIELI